MQNVGATGGVDPELLQARLEAVSDEAARERVRLIIERAIESVRRVQEVPISVVESDVAKYKAMALWSAVDDSVSAVWLSLEELQAEMTPLIDAYEAQSEDSGGGFFDDDDGDLASALEPEPPAADAAQPTAATLVLDGATKRIGETAWAMSFVLSSELKEFRRRLQGLLKLDDGWELLDALNSHIKHLRSAVNAILGGIYASLAGVTGESSADDQTLELTSSRELRSRVFELRDDIGSVEKRLVSTPPGEWLDLLHHTRDLLDHFIFGPGFAWTRAMDKRSFLEQRKSLHEILELWSPLRAEPARLTIQNLARFLDALEVINRRECLVQHDRAALSTVVESMRQAVASEGPESRQAIARGLAALSEASGRDQELDRMLADSMELGSTVPMEKILERTQQVLMQLGG